MARPLIVDGRNFLDAGGLREAGFEYEGIGPQSSRATPHGSSRRHPVVAGSRSAPIVPGRERRSGTRPCTPP